MRYLLIVIALTCLLPGAVFADAAGQIPQSVEPLQSPLTDPNEDDLTTHRHYISKDGQAGHSPAQSKSGHVPAGASAQCLDGSYSFSRHRSGTCSHHGGVATWF